MSATSPTPLTPISTPHAVASAAAANDATPTFSLSSIVNSPGSTLAGAAAILSVLSNALSAGYPTTPSGWVSVIVTVVMGVGAMFAKAGL